MEKYPEWVNIVEGDLGDQHLLDSKMTIRFAVAATDKMNFQIALNVDFCWNLEVSSF